MVIFHSYVSLPEGRHWVLVLGVTQWNISWYIGEYLSFFWGTRLSNGLFMVLIEWTAGQRKNEDFSASNSGNSSRNWLQWNNDDLVVLAWPKKPRDSLSERSIDLTKKHSLANVLNGNHQQKGCLQNAIIKYLFSNLTVCYGKSPFLMGKSTISMAMFNSFLLVYQRVCRY